MRYNLDFRWSLVLCLHWYYCIHLKDEFMGRFCKWKAQRKKYLIFRNTIFLGKRRRHVELVIFWPLNGFGYFSAFFMQQLKENHNETMLETIYGQKYYGTPILCQIRRVGLCADWHLLHKKGENKETFSLFIVQIIKYKCFMF